MKKYDKTLSQLQASDMTQDLGVAYMQSLQQIIHERFLQFTLQETLLNVYTMTLDKEMKAHLRQRHDDWLSQSFRLGQGINIRGAGQGVIPVFTEPCVFWFEGKYDNF